MTISIVLAWRKENWEFWNVLSSKIDAWIRCYFHLSLILPFFIHSLLLCCRFFHPSVLNWTFAPPQRPSFAFHFVWSISHFPIFTCPPITILWILTFPFCVLTQFDFLMRSLSWLNFLLQLLSFLADHIKKFQKLK